MKETLGQKYIDPRKAEDLIRRLAPDGYKIWQPERGRHLFLGPTIAERDVDRIVEGHKALKREDVRQLLVMGGPREQWIVPENVAEELDNFQPIRSSDPVDKRWVQLQQAWKQWVLINPTRAIKYNFNNMSGDLDIALAYDPAIVTKYARQAAKDLWAFKKGEASDEVAEEMLALTKKGVIGSGFRMTEIADITEAGAFRFLMEGDLNPIQKGIDWYWEKARDLTDWRENILRVAANRYFMDKLKEEPQGIYAASRKTEIDAIDNREDKAAKLARELIGDYGNISMAGQWLRRHMMPFYSWIEINAPRYARLLANAKHEGQGGKRGRQMSAVALKKGSMAMLKMNILFAFVSLFNHLFFPDEEKEMRERSRNQHLILGRRDDGTIRSIRMEGALADALEWFNLQDYPSDVADLIQDKKDIEEMAWEAGKAPIDRTINSLEPVLKTGMEVAFGRSAFPSIFREGKGFNFSSRVIRDRPEHIFRVISPLDRLYNMVTGKPHRPHTNPVDTVLEMLLLYNTDPGEAAHWQTKQLVSEWQMERGKEPVNFGTTRKSTALYYWKKAMQWGDEKAAEKWKKEYFERGGTLRGIQQSLDRSAPLGGVALKDRGAFLKSLSESDREMVKMAQEWYNRWAKAGANRTPRRRKN